MSWVNKNLLTVFILVVLFSGISLWADVTKPEIVKLSAAKPKNVNIYFYIDAHHRMCRGTSSSGYKRAIEALKRIMQDPNNPLDGRFRDLNIFVATKNTGMAYLFAPDEVKSFSLTGNNLPDLRNTKRRDWTFDQFIERIAETIPTENSVVCIISNNAVFSQKTGVIYRNSQKNLTFFAMTAGQESVDGPIYAPYWDVEEWEDFISKSMGSNANDMANVIISDYYRLNEQEKEKFKKIQCIPKKHEISLEGFLHTLPKRMWHRVVKHNGEIISAHADSNGITIEPKIGNNEVSVELVSPIGDRYVITWKGNDFSFSKLNEEEAKKTKDAMALLKKYSPKFSKEEISAIESIGDNLDKPINNSSKETLLAVVDSVNKNSQKLIEIDTSFEEARKKVEAVAREKLKNEFAKLVEDYKKATKEQFDEIHKKLDDLKKRADTEITVRKFEEAKTKLIKTLESLKQKYNRAEWKNTERLGSFLQEAEHAKTIRDIEKITREVDVWVKNAKPISLDKFRNQKKIELTDLSAKYESQKEDISNFQDLDYWLRRLDNMTNVEEINDVKWSPKFDAKNLIALVEDRIKQFKPESIKKSSLNKLKSILADAKEVNGNGEKIAQLRAAYKNWSPDYITILDSTKDELIKRAEKWISDYPHAANEIALLEELIASVKDCAAKDIKGFNNIKRSIEEIIQTTPPVPNPIGKRILITIVVLVGILGLLGGISKLRNKKIATIEFKDTNGSETRELSYNKDINLGELGCKFDIHIVCKKGENGDVEYQLNSPSIAIWFSRVGGTKKELFETVLSENDGEFLLFETKNSMKEFARIELRQIIE